MKIGAILTALLVVGVSAVCVRFGFWQVARLHQKQAANEALREALASAPVVLEGRLPPLEAVSGRRVAIIGHYDETRQVLLSGRMRGGAPGVEVVTPLELAGDSSAVLVNRGWLFSADAATARPQRLHEPGERRVIGVSESLRRGAGGISVREFERDSVTLWSARWLDLDSLAARFPYRLAPFAVRQLPDSALPGEPARAAPRPFDETMHLSYAIQWFSFAAILLVGSIAVALRGQRGPAADSDLSIPPVPEESDHG